MSRRFAVLLAAALALAHSVAAFSKHEVGVELSESFLAPPTPYELAAEAWNDDEEFMQEEDEDEDELVEDPEDEDEDEDSEDEDSDSFLDEDADLEDEELWGRKKVVAGQCGGTTPMSSGMCCDTRLKKPVKGLVRKRSKWCDNRRNRKSASIAKKALCNGLPNGSPAWKNAGCEGRLAKLKKIGAKVGSIAKKGLAVVEKVASVVPGGAVVMNKINKIKAVVGQGIKLLKAGWGAIKTCGGVLKRKTTIKQCGSSVVNLALTACDMFAALQIADPISAAVARSTCAAARAITETISVCAKAITGGGGIKQCGQMVWDQVKDCACRAIASKTKIPASKCEKVKAMLVKVAKVAPSVVKGVKACLGKARSARGCAGAIKNAVEEACNVQTLEAEEFLQEEAAKMLYMELDASQLEFVMKSDAKIAADDAALPPIGDFEFMFEDTTSPDPEPFEYEEMFHFFDEAKAEMGPDEELWERDYDAYAKEQLKLAIAERDGTEVPDVEEDFNARAKFGQVKKKATKFVCKRFGKTVQRFTPQWAQANCAEEENRWLKMGKKVYGNMCKGLEMVNKGLAKCEQVSAMMPDKLKLCGQAAAAKVLEPCANPQNTINALQQGQISSTTQVCKEATTEAATVKGLHTVTDAGRLCAQNPAGAGCRAAASRAAATGCTAYAMDVDARDAAATIKAKQACKAGGALRQAARYQAHVVASGGSPDAQRQAAQAVQSAALGACDTWRQESRQDTGFYKVLTHKDYTNYKGCYIGNPRVGAMQHRRNVGLIHNVKAACSNIGNDNMRMCIQAVVTATTAVCAGGSTSAACREATRDARAVNNCGHMASSDNSGKLCEKAAAKAAASFAPTLELEEQALAALEAEVAELDAQDAAAVAA